MEVSSSSRRIQIRPLFLTDHTIEATHSNHVHFLRNRLKIVEGCRLASVLSTHNVLDEIPLSDTFAWNHLIQTHLTAGDHLIVLSLYHHMLLRGVRPDKHTLPRILTACRLSSDLCFTKQVHAHSFKLGLSSDLYVITSLIQTYGFLDTTDTAQCLFDKSPRKNSISWTILARMYLLQNKPDLALHTFNQILDFDATIDHIALATAISACGMLKSLQQGKRVHDIAKRCELESDLLVSNSLVKMYIDCGSIEDAWATFDRMPVKDVISWTEIIRGYVRKGAFNEGLKLFRQMNKAGIKPDSLSITSFLPACARTAAHKHGKEVHGYTLRNGIHSNLMVHNAIVDMYVKSGFIESASNIFARMKKRDVISWTVMIMGYSLHGQGELAVDLFRQIKEDSSIGIDQHTYAAVLHACCTARMVEEGRSYFNCITHPDITHYAVMVALLARAGLFDEARMFIVEHKLESQAEVLRALLDGCRIHRQMNIGKRVMEQLCELEPLNADNYVLLSNWYAENGKWDMVDRFKGIISDMGLMPRKAYSWIEFRNKVHVFGTGDLSHPRSEKIYSELKCLMKKMEDGGGKPKSVFSFHDVDQERECIQSGHSEMLALTFGLISTQVGTTICVTKSLRVCRGCHDSAKAISEIVGREIIIRDTNCFHHFKNGCCSCGDFW